MVGKTLELVLDGSHLNRRFFARDSATVARDLLGRELVNVFDNNAVIKATLIEVAAYEGKTKTSSKGMDYNAGTIGISTKFGQHLIDIATGTGNEPSCITLIAANFNWGNRTELVQGPGKLSKALQIGKEYDSQMIDQGKLWISSVNPAALQVFEREKKPTTNCKGFFYVRL